MDVARQARVSQSTVSLVLSGKATGRVSDDTQEAVLRACRELDYQPNAAARSLRLGRANAVAVVVPNAAHPFFAPMFQGASRAARRRGYAVVLVDAENSRDWQRVVLDTLDAYALDGVLLQHAPESLDLSGLADRVVLMEADSPGVPSLHLDVAGGTRAAVEHLLSLGHGRIAHLEADLSIEAFRIRVDAYRSTLEEAGVPIREEYEERAARDSGPFTVEGGKAAARKLLSLPEPPTAIFCSDDLFAVGAYKAAKEAGLRIPADLSVVGYDDLEIARMIEPELTTVRIPPGEMGARSITLLLDLLEGSYAAETGSTKIPLEFVVRESTGPQRPRSA